MSAKPAPKAINAAPSTTRIRGPIPSLEIEKSLMFFHAYLLGPLLGKLRFYKSRNIRVGSVITSSDWEVLASLLVQDSGLKSTSGLDLHEYEVKSASDGGSYEYQYHKETGIEKLKTDMEVGHLFFNHSDYLSNVELRYIHGSQAKELYFSKWLENFPDPYPQRYRKSIPYGWVKDNAALLLKLKDGEVAFQFDPARPMPG